MPIPGLGRQEWHYYTRTGLRRVKMKFLCQNRLGMVENDNYCARTGNLLSLGGTLGSEVLRRLSEESGKAQQLYIRDE